HAWGEGPGTHPPAIRATVAATANKKSVFNPLTLPADLDVSRARGGCNVRPNGARMPPQRQPPKSPHLRPAGRKRPHPAASANRRRLGRRKPESRAGTAT